MVRTSPRMVNALVRQWQRVHRTSEIIYGSEFLPAMRAALPGQARQPEFRFVARRLWMEIDVDDHPYWRTALKVGLVEAYERQALSFDWSKSSNEAESWVTPELLKDTLSVWQVRVPYRMSIRSGIHYLQTVGRLASAGVEA